MQKSLLLVFATLTLSYGCKHKVPEPNPNLNSTTTTTTTGTTGSSTLTPPPPLLENKKDSICFEEEVEPLLITYCNSAQCHNNDDRRAGINLSSYTALKNTVSGALLIKSIKEVGPLQMPYDTLPKLSGLQISTIEKWVLQGMQIGKDCCDTSSTQSYAFTTAVLPIMMNSCIAACHTTQSPVFTNYGQIVALKDRILCTLGPNAGQNNQCSVMPRAPYTLSYCGKRKILKWIENGTPNN